jgi:hypothetical protein
MSTWLTTWLSTWLTPWVAAHPTATFFLFTGVTTAYTLDQWLEKTEKVEASNTLQWVCGAAADLFIVLEGIFSPPAETVAPSAPPVASAPAAGTTTPAASPSVVTSQSS